MGRTIPGTQVQQTMFRETFPGDITTNPLLSELSSNVIQLLYTSSSRHGEQAKHSSETRNLGRYGFPCALHGLYDVDDVEELVDSDV